jgi:Fe-S oxidoreductase
MRIKKSAGSNTNNANSGMDREFDEKYFKKLRHIVTVSAECGAALGQFFPDLSGKIEIIHNIVSEKLIYKLAGNGNAPELKDGQINIVSVGRLSPKRDLTSRLTPVVFWLKPELMSSGMLSVMGKKGLCWKRR